MLVNLPEDWNASLDTLTRCLEHPALALSSFACNLVDVVAEMYSWATDNRPYNPMWAKHPWESLIAEYFQAELTVGPLFRESLAEVAAPLSAALREMNHHENASERSASVPALVDPCREFLGVVDSDASIGIAWDDLVDAAFGAAVNYAQIASIRDLFIAVARRHGHELSSFGSAQRVSEILGDAYHTIRRLSPLINNESAAQDVVEDGPQKIYFGMPLEKRLELARRIWTSGDVSAEITVWLEIDRAMTGFMSLKFGQVTFYNYEWLSGNIHNDQQVDLALADEGARESFSHWIGDGNRETVIARVDLGRHRRSSAVADAIDLVEMIMRISGSLIERTGWHIGARYWLCVNGRPGVSTWGRGPRRDRLADLGWEGQDLDSRRLELLRPKNNKLDLSPDFRAVLNALRSITASKEVDPSARLALHVQIVERINASSYAYDYWHDFVQEFLADHWIFLKVKNDLVNAARTAADCDKRWLNDSDSARMKSVHENMYRATGDPRDGVEVTNIHAGAIDLLRILDRKYFPGLYLRWVTRAVSQNKSAAYADVLRREFSMKLAQAKRCRDSAVHGGPLASGSVEQAAEFTQMLATMALWGRIQGLLEGKHVTKIISELLVEFRWRVERIASGEFDVAMGPYAGPPLA
jgi:hypothetical protein